MDRASAFLSAAELIPFLDSEKSDSLHIGNDPNREKSAIRKRRSTKRDAAVEGVKRLRDERRAEAAAQKSMKEAAAVRGSSVLNQWFHPEECSGPAIAIDRQQWCKWLQRCFNESGEVAGEDHI